MLMPTMTVLLAVISPPSSSLSFLLFCFPSKVTVAVVFVNRICDEIAVLLALDGAINTVQHFCPADDVA